LRDLMAVVIAALACPVAVFGGTNVGCVGQGFNSDCAMNAIFISPLVLLAAGVATGVVTRGWTGMLLVFIGTVIGMTSILVVSYASGRPVPLDPISGLIATVWFLAPLTIGYGMGRLVWRMFASRDGEDGEDGAGR
jgi:hypothetical protein